MLRFSRSTGSSSSGSSHAEVEVAFRERLHRGADHQDHDAAHLVDLLRIDSLPGRSRVTR